MATYNKDFRVKHGLVVEANTHINQNLQVDGTINVSSNTTSNSYKFNTSAGVSVAQGEMAWNSSDGTVDIGVGYADVVLQVGQETHYIVRNNTGSQILNGTALYCSGVTTGSGRLEVSPMIGNGSIDPVQFIGLATHNINNGVNGIATYFGYIRGIDTRGTANTALSVGDEDWQVGDKLYVHPTANGKLTKVEPQAPNTKICTAVVITRHQTVGVLFVRPTTNLVLSKLSDAQINTVSDGELLQYVSANNRWENKSSSSIIEPAFTQANSAITLAQAAFDQANTGGGGSANVGLYITNDTFTANGLTDSFTLSVTPINEESTIINFDGVVQQKSEYSLSGRTITFAETPNTGTLIEVSSFVNAGNGIFIATEGGGISSIIDNDTSVIINDAGTNSNIQITVDGTQTVRFTSNSILPNLDQTYNLGSPELQWKDVYIGPGSLYINGQKVIQESSGTIKFSADQDQNLRIETTGDGNIELDPTQTGSILLQGPVQIQSNSNISSSDGNPIGFGSTIATDSVTSKTLNTNLGLSANGTGIVSVNDDLTVTGNLTVQGSAVNLSVNTLTVQDNIIDISSETTGSPTSNAGIRVVRGDEPAVQLRWNETSDKWQFTNDGTTYIDMGGSSDVSSLIGQVSDKANGAYNQANTATNNAASASSYANTGVTLAQAAFNNSNTKFSSSGGTINGSVVISGGSLELPTGYQIGWGTGAPTFINGSSTAVYAAIGGARVFTANTSGVYAGFDKLALDSKAQAAFDKANTAGGGGGTGTVSLNNDTTSTNTFFPVFANSTTGNVSTIYTSNDKFLYKPSTGDLFAEQINADNGLFVNRTTILNSHTIAEGFAGLSSGPVTLANGVTLTISANSKWSVI